MSNHDSHHEGYGLGSMNLSKSAGGQHVYLLDSFYGNHHQEGWFGSGVKFDGHPYPSSNFYVTGFF